MNWDRFLGLSFYERWLMHDELDELIERYNETGAPRPKEMR